jgi:predicted AlkP superfamily phosphohydrolase/phosphomutase
MPEETKALRAGVLTADEFLAQARIAADETIRQLWYTLDRFDDGLLFYYFGNVDQVSHVMWRAMDPEHPAFTAADRPYQAVVEDLYADVDEIVGATASRLGSSDLPDVGSRFSWRRSFSVSSGCATRLSRHARSTLATDPALFSNVDWSLRGLLVSVYQRPRRRRTRRPRRRTLAAEIAAGLVETVDAATGLRPIRRVFQREGLFPRRRRDIAPDLIIRWKAAAV